ncbi:MAG: T9SS type A sorting domain-containing protein [Candidatus Cloacimonetes bacterium]|nr:T9SS type A sorting domain-containing protein [Candidatus Cloacimonadota bacterium]
MAEAPANAANGSAINSIPVTITLPQIGTYPQQSIEIAPNIGDGDFLVAVDEPAANTISYSITAADGELPGSYIIHHPGFTASNLEVLSAEYDAVTLANGSSSLSITSFTGKGTLQILLNLDETLPVQMGRMMLVPTGINGVNLQWFSYSESELAGYYVLRSESNDLNQAQYVSSMIEATNTSSTTLYMFHDTDVSESCYYWLEARDYSGSSEFFGPEYYEKQSPGNDTPPILKDTLHAIYPNPFNPSTTISYSLAEPQAISIKIYDARGRLVHRHDEANKSAGRYQYIWNAEGAASGVYFVKLEIGERSFERKLVLLK